MGELDHVSENTGYAFNITMKKSGSCLTASYGGPLLCASQVGIPGFLVSRVSSGSPQKELFLDVLG